MIKLILTNVSAASASFNGVTIPAGSSRDVTMPENSADALWTSLQALVPATFTVKPFGADVDALQLIAQFELAEVAEAAGNTTGWRKDADDALAATTTAESCFFKAPAACKITGISILPDGALTAHATDYATITINKHDGAGGGAAAVVALTTEITGSGDWTAFTTLDMGTLANNTMDAGDLLTVTIAKAAGGVVVPACAIIVDYIQS